MKTVAAFFVGWSSSLLFSKGATTLGGDLGSVGVVDWLLLLWWSVLLVVMIYCERMERAQ